MEVEDKAMILMRCLTAAQAALWDVVDEPDHPGKQLLLGIMTTRCARLGAEFITRKEH